MRNRFVWTCLLIASLYSVPALARKIDLTNEKFSTFVGGSFGQTNVNDSAYGQSSGSNTSTDAKVPWNTSGDVGATIALGDINIVLAAELLMPRAMSGVAGTDSSGTNLFSLQSNIYGFIPMVNVEIPAFKSANSRFLFGLGGGYAMVSIENNYVMTSAGQSAFSVTDFSERAKGTATLLQLYVAKEYAFTDTASVVFSAGYRNCNVQSFSSTVDVKAIVGQEASGQALLNNDGSHRILNLSGAFAGLSFRFYM